MGASVRIHIERARKSVRYQEFVCARACVRACMRVRSSSESEDLRFESTAPARERPRERERVRSPRVREECVDRELRLDLASVLLLMWRALAHDLCLDHTTLQIQVCTLYVHACAAAAQ